MRIRKIGKVLLYAAAGLVGLALLSVLVLKLILDRVPRYKVEIKAWVHAQTGYHIDFASVAPSLRWYGPELSFEWLELRSKDDQRLLARAAGGRIGIDLWELIHSGKLLAGRIELNAPNLTVNRLGATRFAIASEIELGSDEAKGTPVNVDDLPQGELAIRHAVITLQNWNAALPSLVLQDVSVDLRHERDTVVAAFNGQLPADLGGSVALRGTVRGRGDVSGLSWDASARAENVSFGGWHQLLPEYLSSLDAGQGAFNMTASGRGKILARADLDFSASGVATQFVDGPIAKFEQLSGVLTLRHAGPQWSLRGVRVRTAAHDPESSFQVAWHIEDAGLMDLHARANYLRAETLLPLTALLPQKNVRDNLRDIAPTGEWIDTSLSMSRQSIGAPWALQVQAKFHDAGFAPLGRAPGLRGLSGTLAGDDSGGHVFIDSDSAVFTWPAQFAHPIDLQTLRGRIYWKRSAAELLVASPDWEVKTRDAGMRGKASWQQPSDGTSPVFTLVSAISDGNVANTSNYLPHGLLAPPAFAWLNRAFVAGHMTRADVLLQGALRRFPFRDGGGLFLIRAAFDGVTLDYNDGWPPVTNLSANAIFRNEGMSVHMLNAHVGDIAISSADAHFPDFKTGELKINLSAEGDASSALSFLRSTPLDANAEHVFSGVEASGGLRSTVELFLPFKDFVHRRVLVHGHLDGATVNRPGSTTKATEVSGEFDLDNGQVATADINGMLLGGPFQMQSRAARNRPLTRTQLEFRGTVNADALRGALSMPAGMAIHGQTDWRGVLKISPEPARERSLRLSSTLVGMQLQLPAPLDKPADAPLPASLEIQWPASGGMQGHLMLGTVVGGTYVLEPDGAGFRLAHASLVFGAGDPAVGDSQIFNLGGAVERVDLAGWLKLTSPDKNAKPLSYYLHEAHLDVAEVDYLGLAFKEVAVNLAADNDGLHIALSGPNVAGKISIPAGADSPEPWVLQFERLKFETDERAPQAAGSSATTEFVSPSSIPAINFHAADLLWGERRFGDVHATLLKLNDGVSLQHLVVNTPSFTVTAQGEWRGKNAGLSRIEGTIQSTDVQRTLADLGYADVLQAKNGKMDFDLNWVGAPTAESLGAVGGHVQLALDKGQVTGLSPGAGRVLGLASIAALPRRLALDFSDLTDKGLAFDTIRGDFDLSDGNANTDNVLLKGPAAEIGLIGRVGLKNRDYDQTAVVTAAVGGPLSIPVASAFLAGPVVGAAVLLFTQVFKQPLKGLARGYYRITGAWDNPTVERIKSGGTAQPSEGPK